MTSRNIDKNQPIVAYFSMEIALENDLKTYAGGLGVLAGDLLKSAVRLNFPLVGLTLFNRHGYFKQKITTDGRQIVQPEKFPALANFKKLPTTVMVEIGARSIKVGVWEYRLAGVSGGYQPVYFLDTNLPGNHPSDQALTGELYGGDRPYRLKQEIILGRGGVKILRALGYNNVKKFHLNEGHGALAAIELLVNSDKNNFSEKLKEVRHACVFTTHTPLMTTQEVYRLDYLLKFQPDFPVALDISLDRDKINFTSLGLYLSGYINAVSRKHQTTARKMFPSQRIKEITNGVDAVSWAAPEFARLYDRHITGWRARAVNLSKAGVLPLAEIQAAHQATKQRLFKKINQLSAVKFREDIFTIGFARRFAAYKRPGFLFQDLKRLSALAEQQGELQLIFSGKAHPRDLIGQNLIRKIWEIKKILNSKIKIFFWEDYDLVKAGLLVAGVDLWLNTPAAPQEASGTSGMKAAVNGVPQLSTLDGWWPEGYQKNKTGWAIRERNGRDNLYDLLAKEILPLYYESPAAWAEMMRSTISLNASYFNTDRVLAQYIEEAYLWRQ